MKTRLSNQDREELHTHTRNNHGKEPIAFRNPRGEVVWVHPEEYGSVSRQPVPDNQVVKKSQAADLVERLFDSAERFLHQKRRLL